MYVCIYIYYKFIHMELHYPKYELGDDSGMITIDFPWEICSNPTGPCGFFPDQICLIYETQ